MGHLGGLTMRTRVLRLLPFMTAAALTLSACLPRDAGIMRPPTSPPDATAASGGQHTANAGQWPLSFVENRGQLDPHIGYYVPTPHASTFFTATGLTYALTPDAASRWIVSAEFVGGDPN